MKHDMVTVTATRAQWEVTEQLLETTLLAGGSGLRDTLGCTRREANSVFDRLLSVHTRIRKALVPK